MEMRLMRTTDEEMYFVTILFLVRKIKTDWIRFSGLFVF